MPFSLGLFRSLLVSTSNVMVIGSSTLRSGDGFRMVMVVLPHGLILGVVEVSFTCVITNSMPLSTTVCVV